MIQESKNKTWLYGLIGLLLGVLLTMLAIRVFSGTEAHEHAQEVQPTTAGAQEIWTCSMHPQIRQPEPGDCAVCGMDLIPLVENSSNDPLVLEMTEEAVRLSDIQTTIVGAGAEAGSKTLRLSGNVQADERLASSQVAHVPGRIEKLYVTFTGEQVRKGQKLADIYAPELIAAQRELLEAVKLQDLNPGLLTAARNKLRYWKIPEATITRIEENGLIQETFPIFADAGGVVTNKLVNVGDYLQRGEPLFTLINLSKVWVLFEAYEEDLAQLKMGDRIEFTTPALPKQTFTAKVTFIDPVVDSRTRTVALRTEVNNRQGLLKPEMLVYGSLLQKATISTELLVPKSAVLWMGPRSVVYVKIPDTTVPSFQYRAVEIGEANGNFYRINTGLDTGEEVVTYGSFVIDAAAQLNNQASMINQEVALKTEAEAAAALPDYTAISSADFQQQLAVAIAQYLALKDALVDSDPETAVVTATALNAAILELEAITLPAETQVYWQQQASALKAHSEAIIATADLDNQRQQFDFLSQALIRTVKVFGAETATLYVQHCPMAANNAGADWLSEEEKILNPYFGDAMLRCGVVEDILE